MHKMTYYETKYFTSFLPQCGHNQNDDKTVFQNLILVHKVASVTIIVECD